MRIRRSAGVFTLAPCLAFLGAWILARPVPAAAAPVPVLVEAFTSEGCSSCPPADAYLGELDRTQPIAGATVLAIEEHVDYWDGLGWRDPFAMPDNGARQRAYARVLEDHGVFTPEVVLDGQRIVRPQDAASAARAIAEAARAPHARVSVGRTGERLSIDISGLPALSPGERAGIWLAVTESGLVSRVERGENAGRTLPHAPVLRSLRRIGSLTQGNPATHLEATMDTSASWRTSNLRAVVFLQTDDLRQIVGVGSP